MASSLVGCPRPEGDPAKSETRLALARDFLVHNELEAAEAEANKALGYLASNEEAYNVRGLVHHFRAANAQALMEIDSCVTGVDAEALRSDLDSELVLAQRDFKQAVELAPDYAEAWSNAGTVAFLLEDYDSAKIAFETALANPARLVSPGLTRANLGWVFFMQQNYVGAAKELRQAIQFQPGMCVATYRLGRVYFAREEWENAADKFQEVSDQADCRSQESALYLMKARLEQGLLDDAKVAQVGCVSRAPKSCLAAQCRSAAMQPGSAAVGGAR